MAKDRSRRLILAQDVDLLVEQSSHPPPEYAITLRALRDGQWHAVRLIDNAHGVDQHDEHRYIGSEKQAATTFISGTANEAMAAAIDQLSTSWRSIVEAWDRTR